MVAAVIGLEPQTEANPALAAMVPMASPPGKRRSHIAAARNRAAPRPEIAITSPISTKSGTMTRTKLQVWEYAMFAI